MAVAEPKDEHDHAQPLGEALRSRRRALHLTQQELADLAGCARRTVHAIEAGKPSVRLNVLLDVLDALGLRLRLEPGRGPLVTDG